MVRGDGFTGESSPDSPLLSCNLVFVIIILYSLIASWFDLVASLPLSEILEMGSSCSRGRGDGDRSTSSSSRSHSQRSEIIRYRTDEENGHGNHCSAGHHQLGTCSCDSQFLGDELRVLVRISRIVFLVEAIGELLDEMTREAMPFSLSTLSLPAPESTVNSFPLKIHKKSDAIISSWETQQCYICLSEYGEGDNIRVLPCKHEYHMGCIDKWLKEIHGICPLCRDDVCVGSPLHSTQDTES